MDGQGCVKVRTNCYSAPLRAGTQDAGEAAAGVCGGLARATLRGAARTQLMCAIRQVLDLEHYLDVLERKPGALAGSTPLEQWRERGRWPESFDRFWQGLRERHGKQAGHAGDDRVAAAGTAARLGSVAGSGLRRRWRWAARMRPRCGICWLAGTLTHGERPLPADRPDWGATSGRCRR